MQNEFTELQLSYIDKFHVRPMNTIGLYGPQENRSFDKSEMKLLSFMVECEASPSPRTNEVSEQIILDYRSSNNPTLLNILEKRCAFHNINYNPLHLIAICLFSDGLPSNAIMYLHTANAARVLLGKEIISIFDMFKFFVVGIPTNEALSAWWVSNYKDRIDTTSRLVWPQSLSDLD